MLGLGASVLGAICLLTTLAAPAAAAPAPDPWLGLDSGRMGDYLWSVEAGHTGGRTEGGSLSAQQPCLLVGTTWELGPFSYRRSKYRACTGPDTGYLAASEPPVIATAVQPSTGAPVAMTAVGMILAPAVRRVVITLSDDSRMAVPLHRLTPNQAHAARLGRFQYAAFAVHGWWCAERMVTLGASGNTLWDSGTDEYSCTAAGPQLPAPPTP